MKVFNPNKELKKLQHGNKNKIIAFIFLILTVGIIGYSFALYQVRYSKRIIYTKVAPFSNKDLNLAVYVNGEKQNKAPEINSGYKLLTMICDTPYDGNPTWDDSNALLSLPPMPIPNKCNVYLIDNNYDEIKTFEYSGDVQEYTVPKDGLYKIELWGAGGGKGIWGSNIYYLAGNGGYTSGMIKLSQNEKLYFYVGKMGATAVRGAYNKSGISFNGGGSGIGATDGDDGGGSGGGATDVRIEKGSTWDDFNSLKSRIMVAGGGGGGASTAAGSVSYITAGSGGGLNGVGDIRAYNGLNLGTSFNATQVNGYKYGIGEDGATAGNGGGGGGGGYYGGLAGNSGSTHGGAGGGSSFISGHIGCNAINQNSTQNNITHTDNPNHYSGKVFTNTVMIDGLGYQWTNKQGSYVGMPTFDGKGTMQGNKENGYAKITYFGSS